MIRSIALAAGLGGLVAARMLYAVAKLDRGLARQGRTGDRSKNRAERPLRLERPARLSCLVGQRTNAVEPWRRGQTSIAPKRQSA
jgi:hypothetical protein